MIRERRGPFLHNIIAFRPTYKWCVPSLEILVLLQLQESSKAASKNILFGQSFVEIKAPTRPSKRPSVSWNRDYIHYYRHSVGVDQFLQKIWQKSRIRTFCGRAVEVEVSSAGKKVTATLGLLHGMFFEFYIGSWPSGIWRQRQQHIHVADVNAETLFVTFPKHHKRVDSRKIVVVAAMVQANMQEQAAEALPERLKSFTRRPVWKDSENNSVPPSGTP